MSKRHAALMSGLALLLAVCAILLPGQVRPVSAQAFHAVLVRCEPADNSILAHAPGIIRLWFSEPVQLVEPSLTIYGPSGGIVEQGTVQALNNEISVPFNARAD